jgi:hypothetical protein
MIRPAGAPKQRIATAELRAWLARSLGHHFAAPRRVAELERWPSAYSTSYAIDELDVRLGDGTSLRLLFKDLSRHAMLEHARQVKPPFLYDPLRELETYRVILGASRLGTPTCYGTVADHRAGHYGLFLEKIPGVELYQVGDIATWGLVARWLASMHARFAGEVGRFAEAAPLLSYDEGFYWQWILRARAFSGRAEPPSQRKTARRGIEWLAGRYDRVVERLVALPATFVHGEFYASNVLVHGAGGEVRVRPVDWEMAAVGPGLVDLAALTAGGGWTAEEKTALALAYHAALAPRGGWPPERDAFLAALDCCRIHLAVQWLGWSPRWSPPLEQKQNWLEEALALAEKLGL